MGTVLCHLFPYDSAIGSLIYPMICTRPNLAYAMSKVCGYMSNLGKNHWMAIKWMLRYVRGTIDRCLVFKGELPSNLKLVGYVDADHAQDLDTRKSTSRFVFTFGGGCISWKSTLQKCVSQSTTEAEYVAAAEAAKEGIWLSRLVQDFGYSAKGIELYCDSSSALHLASNQKTDSRTKHIDVRYHFIRQMVEEKSILLLKIEGKLNPADALTKVIPHESFVNHREKLQIEELH